MHEAVPRALVSADVAAAHQEAVVGSAADVALQVAAVGSAVGLAVDVAVDEVVDSAAHAAVEDLVVDVVALRVEVVGSAVVVVAVVATKAPTHLRTHLSTHASSTLFPRTPTRLGHCLCFILCVFVLVSIPLICSAPRLTLAYHACATTRPRLCISRHAERSYSLAKS